ncbi:hypothetical protein BGX24_001239 [Mortierella sp. AD032]|nr:hypothetical protein BGX24_001239 [Mortierella sp. AD032]
MATSGTPPSMRADHCMTTNDDGTKVVVYGGRPANGAPSSGEVFILDTVTGLWTQGTSGQPRLYAVCAIAGDQLLVWGGVATGNVIAPGAVSLYNIATNSWVIDYTPPASYVALAASASASTKPTGTGTPGTGGGGGEEKSGSSVGGIVGGIVGGLAVIAGIVGFLLFRRRRSQQQGQGRHQPIRSSSGHPEQSPPTSATAAHGSEEGQDEIKRMQSQLENQQQQLELQRQLLALQQQQPVMTQQDPYSYQPPVYYTAVTSAPTVQTVPDTSYAAYTIPVVSPTHSEMYTNDHTFGMNVTPSPLIYMPPPPPMSPSTPSDYTLPAMSQVASSPALSTSAVSTDMSSPYPYAVSAPVKKSQLSGPQSLITPTSVAGGGAAGEGGASTTCM